MEAPLPELGRVPVVDTGYTEQRVAFQRFDPQERARPDANRLADWHWRKTPDAQYKRRTFQGFAQSGEKSAHFHAADLIQRESGKNTGGKGKESFWQLRSMRPYNLHGALHVTPSVRFDCVAGCGVCCKDRFVPLTLAETEQWLARGDDVVVLLEAFATEQSPDASAEYWHHHARSDAARSGTADLQVIAVLAAANLQGCPNQLADTRCGIYSERPLVCRIYPMEINPFIPLAPANKECPTSAWSSPTGEQLIASDGQPPLALRQLIEASRQADREDALAKVDICRHLGFDTTAWKGNGFAIYFPEREQLLQAIALQRSTTAPAVQWRVRAHGEPLLKHLTQLGVQLAEEAPDHVFIPLAG